MTFFTSEISASRTLDPHEDVLLCDATAGPLTVTLPPAEGRDGKVYHVKKTDSTSSAVTIDAHLSETIDGAATLALGAQYDASLIICDGTGWHTLAMDSLQDPLNVTFTATNTYSYAHNRGLRPATAVSDSNGKEIEVCVQHTDTNTVVLGFNGTLTNAVLSIS